MYRKRFKQNKRFNNKASSKSLSSRVLLDLIRCVKATNQEVNSPLEQQKRIHNSFEEFNLSLNLVQNILKKGYSIPTPIQDKAIPAILEGHDVTGIANTGTGKTAAFLIPLINKIIDNPIQKVLIIAPTRELALQIREEFKNFSEGFNIRSILLIGGSNIKRQKEDLKKNPQFVIGTPGRIKDLLKGRNFSLSSFHTVVLDEADRMVDIGFINDIKYFISLLPKDRQSLFFSATIDGKVKEILNGFVHNSTLISVKQQNTADSIEQDVINVIPGYRKIDMLHELLIKKEFTKVIIFGRTKWSVQKLTAELTDRGFKTAAIHGNKNQNQRQKALNDFKMGAIQVLLATDVASRGLDIQDISHVINYEMPATLDDYIHRIGRTGRADKKGKALTFIDR